MEDANFYGQENVDNPGFDSDNHDKFGNQDKICKDVLIVCYKESLISITRTWCSLVKKLKMSLIQRILNIMVYKSRLDSVEGQICCDNREWMILIRKILINLVKRNEMSIVISIV